MVSLQAVMFYLEARGANNSTPTLSQLFHTEPGRCNGVRSLVSVILHHFCLTIFSPFFLSLCVAHKYTTLKVEVCNIQTWLSVTSQMIL